MSFGGSRSPGLSISGAFDLGDQSAQQFGRMEIVAAVEPTAVLGKQASKFLKRLPHTASHSNSLAPRL